MTLPLSRRTLIGGAAATFLTAPAILRAQQLFTAYPFRLGVAAGDPAPDGFVIWTRLAPEPLEPHGGMPLAPVEVSWVVAEDEGFRTVASEGTAIARPEVGHSVHVEVDGLQPGRPYFYRFSVGRERSFYGRAKTAPAPGSAPERVRFAVAGCQAYEDGFFTAYRDLAAQADLDFVFHYGDYHYEYSGSPVRVGNDGRLVQRVRAHSGARETYDLNDYRRRYAEIKADPDLQTAHASAAFFTTFDDHETDNNWVGSIDQDGTPPEIFLLRRAAAFQAWYEHMPVRRASIPGPDGIRIHQRQSYGTLLDAHFLDTRSFRTDQPCDDGFKPDCPGVDDPRAQVLGTEQERWLSDGLRASRARWNLVAQQIMVMPLDRRTGDEAQPIRNMDSWAAYTAPRERLLERLGERGNCVVLTGDEHQNFAGELRRNRGQGDVVAPEFVSTSISSGGDGADRRATAQPVLDRNPFLKDTNDQRGYTLCEVTPATWQTQWRVVERVTAPDAPVTTRSTWAVEYGSPVLHGS